jgi:hypothetical protein
MEQPEGKPSGWIWTSAVSDAFFGPPRPDLIDEFFGPRRTRAVPVVFSAAPPAEPPAAGGVAPAAAPAAPARGGRKRRAYDRDHTFLKWQQEEMTPARIRDRWNREHPDEAIAEGTPGCDTVKKGIRRARAERAAKK